MITIPVTAAGINLDFSDLLLNQMLRNVTSAEKPCVHAGVFKRIWGPQKKCSNNRSLTCEAWVGGAFLDGHVISVQRA